MEIPFRILVIFVIALIVLSLGEGMYYLARDSGRIERLRVVKALTARIGLSLLLFALLVTAHLAGWVR